MRHEHQDTPANKLAAVTSVPTFVAAQLLTT